MDCVNNNGSNNNSSADAIAKDHSDAAQYNNWLTRENLQSAVAARLNMNLVLRNTAASFSCPNTPGAYPVLQQGNKQVTSTWTPTMTMPISSIAMMDTLPLLAHLHHQQQQQQQQHQHQHQQQQQQQHLMVPNAMAQPHDSHCQSKQYCLCSQAASSGVVPPAWFLQHRRNEEQSSVHSFSASASPASSSSTECSSPLDLSFKSSLNDIPSEADGDLQPTQRASILRNLLSCSSVSSNDVSAGQSHYRSGESSCVLTPSSCTSAKQPVQIQVQIEDCDSANDSNIFSAFMNCKLKAAECDDPRVCLAKKNLHPVTSRVTTWLQQIVKFCEEIPAFKHLNEREQARLLQDSWHYLLLLCMAEQNFQFAVSICSPDRADDELARELGSSDVPTLRFVENLQSLIRKLHSLGLDRVEYGLLMTAVLFYSGQQQESSLTQEKCAELNRLYGCVLSMLQQRMTMTRDSQLQDSPVHSSGYTTYTRLLLTLPAIYSIRQTLVQNFFFGAVSLDVSAYVSKLLLKEAALQPAQTP